MEETDVESLIAHFREFYGYYIMGVICVLPFIIVFRRVAVPAIMYLVELIVYAALFHCFTYVVVATASWFKDQSTMKRARDLVGDDYNPGWSTPIPDFWNVDAYNPHWLIYFEGVMIFVIIALMWKYRPLRMKRPKKKAETSKIPRPYDYRKVK
jgi:hypothetical protein